MIRGEKFLCVWATNIYEETYVWTISVGWEKCERVNHSIWLLKKCYLCYFGFWNFLCWNSVFLYFHFIEWIIQAFQSCDGRLLYIALIPNCNVTATAKPNSMTAQHILLYLHCTRYSYKYSYTWLYYHYTFGILY